MKAVALFVDIEVESTKWCLSKGTDRRTDGQTDGQAETYIPPFHGG